MEHLISGKEITKVKLVLVNIFLSNYIDHPTKCSLHWCVSL